ncbi:hypothetical protein MUO65_05875 [bacterium]|nr:hypothetical protein [bacterium]
MGTVGKEETMGSRRMEGFWKTPSPTPEGLNEKVDSLRRRLEWLKGPKGT